MYKSGHSCMCILKQVLFNTLVKCIATGSHGYVFC